MSETVASGLQMLDEENTRATRLFIRMIDMFFDALNVKNTVEGKVKRKHSENLTLILQMKDLRYNFGMLYINMHADICSG